MILYTLVLPAMITPPKDPVTAGVDAVNGVHRYLLWLDLRTSLSVRTKLFDLKGEPVEDVLKDDLEIGIDIPDFFSDL